VEEGEPFLPPNMDETDDHNPLFFLKRAMVWLDELNIRQKLISMLGLAHRMGLITVEDGETLAG